MQNISLNVEQNGETLNFEVAEYLHHQGESCTFEVYRNGAFVAGFEPDGHGGLIICKNPGVLEDEVLYLISDKLEALQF